MNIRKIIIIVFLSVPLLSSIISSIHLVTFFNLGNIEWMSFILAITFEIGSLAALLVITTINNVNKNMLWTIFFILTFLQIFGNVYYSYDYILKMSEIYPKWLNTIDKLFFYFVEDKNQSHLIISLILGVPIPLISLFFLKSTINYLSETGDKIYNINNKIENVIPVKKEEPIINIPVTDREKTDENAVFLNQF